MDQCISSVIYVNKNRINGVFIRCVVYRQSLMFLGYSTKSLEKRPNENISFILCSSMIAIKLSASMKSQ